MAVMFTCQCLDFDPVKSFPLHQAALAVTQQLGKLVEENVKAVHSTGFIAGIIDKLHQEYSPLKDYGVTQIIDFYLSDEGKVHLPEINRLAKLDTAGADEKLLHYAMEAIRISGTFYVYREAVESLVINDNGRDVPVKAGDQVFVSFVDAAKDPKVFPNPDKVLLDRPLESYIHYGAGPHACLGRGISKVLITAVLKTIGRLDNLRRAPGDQGRLKKIPRPGGFHLYMKEDYGGYFPFPTTMKINFDGELPELQDVPGKANGAKNAATTAGPSSQKK
ncbi:hypothetical protein GP486_005232 [Trichoglossum hirsutum]|uniref:Uncharacterized protein n=1 Tax=Trichoglossum hirsutum TaxID=265104 RepID=A0A9P8L9V6_9PEZI|nr:hypothetical protein GP486_005232 [Trichoglossum hirsutum]